MRKKDTGPESLSQAVGEKGTIIKRTIIVTINVVIIITTWCLFSSRKSDIFLFILYNSKFKDKQRCHKNENFTPNRTNSTT
ncbi:MAG: hypothetical protein KA074_01330 [Bacteroidales bacterium]|nr:hypothetical protein [Bacteroidales bacterium]